MTVNPLHISPALFDKVELTVKFREENQNKKPLSMAYFLQV